MVEFSPPANETDNGQVLITVDNLTQPEAHRLAQQAAQVQPEGSPDTPVVIEVNPGAGFEMNTVTKGALTSVELERTRSKRLLGEVLALYDSTKNPVRHLSLSRYNIGRKIRDVTESFKQNAGLVTAVILKFRVPTMAAGLYVTTIFLLGSHSSLEMVTKLFLVATIINYFQTTHLFHDLLTNGGIRRMISSMNGKIQASGLQLIREVLNLSVFLNWADNPKRVDLMKKLDQFLTMYGISIASLSILSHLEGAHFTSLTLVMLSFIFMWDFLFESTSAMLKHNGLITEAILARIGSVRITTAPVIEAAALVGSGILAPSFMATVGLIGLIGVLFPKPTVVTFVRIKEVLGQMAASFSAAAVAEKPKLTDLIQRLATSLFNKGRERAAHMGQLVSRSVVTTIGTTIDRAGSSIRTLGTGMGNLVVLGLSPAEGRPRPSTLMSGPVCRWLLSPPEPRR
ncbi:MAG: hypothetical protein K1X29_11045 [Bdellovibrionales bacterium]|nr:hypothetical protein [Bdellovibrionales bacterium]